MIPVDFQTVAPGLMVFSVLMLASYTATSLAREVETRAIARFRVAGRGFASLLVGNIAAHIVLAAVAFGLMFGAAMALGLRPAGPPLAMFVIVMVNVLGVLGFGLLIAAAVKRREDATNLAFMVLLLLGFLSGAFFALPEVPMFDVAGRTWGLYDLLPPAHAADGLRAVIFDGAGLNHLGFELVSLSVTGAAWLAIGALTFWGVRMRAAV